MTDDKYLEKLNKEQREAVEYIKGPLYVVAGAGTGKTRTLTSKLAYLIEKGYSPESLLAVTFTNKAAKEMKERVATIVGDTAYRMWVFTFHAFGVRVLRQHIEYLDIKGLTRSFEICDEDDSISIIKDILKEFDADTKSLTPKKVRTLISKFQNHEISVFSHKKEEDIFLSNVFRMYRERLIYNNQVDFDGLLLYTLDLFEQIPEVKEYYQSKFKYILVDEFQDTNSIQYAIIRLLGEEHRKIFVVGDPDQSIYSFRGANYENSKLFIKEYEAKIIIDENFRSTNNILRSANSLIKHNKKRVAEKDLTSSLGDGIEVEFSKFNNDLAETYYIAREINFLVDSGGYYYKDIVVLYRNNNLSRIIEETFIRSQIPYVIYGGISFFERREIKDVLAYIRCALDYAQNFYLKRIINVPRRKIGNSTIEKLEQKAFASGISYFDAIDELELSNTTKTNLKEFKEIINKLHDKLLSDDPIMNIVDDILDITKYKDYLLEDGEEGKDRLNNVLELKNILTRGEYFYEGTKTEKIRSILDEIALITDLESSIAEENRVVLSTYHQIKGLEFKVVFLVALEEGIFPNPMMMLSNDDLEEERRVAYVGVTRAKERLYVSSAKQRYRFGHIENLPESRFVGEMKVKKEKTVIPGTQATGLLKSGDRVSHQVFGNGIVIMVKEKVATIAFSAPHNIKQIAEDHPSIRKIN